MAAIPIRWSSSRRKTRGTRTNTRWTAGNRWPRARHGVSPRGSSPARRAPTTTLRSPPISRSPTAKAGTPPSLEAILRNTSLFLLRRNLALDANNQPRDGRYIFISGPGYGWKQWVSDGFYTALGLDDPEKTIESNRAVFWTRMDYEDNAQYYLIWAVLMKRAGGTVNEPLVRRAYEFLRRHEKDGFYIPPPLPGSPNPQRLEDLSRRAAVRR